MIAMLLKKKKGPKSEMPSNNQDGFLQFYKAII